MNFALLTDIEKYAYGNYQIPHR